jgi:hypothetical protein
MYHPDKTESANGWRLKQAIARVLQYQAVVVERYKVFKGEIYSSKYFPVARSLYSS